MQQYTDIERTVEPKLIAAYGETDGKALWGGYTKARQKIVHDIAPYISRFELDLTDHSARHIKNVLHNAYRLLGEKTCTGFDPKSALNANEMYFLVLSILFHDLGNIFGRKDHNRRLEEVYAYARGNEADLLSEKRHLRNIVEAHCGQTREGHKDTIGSLDSAAVFREERLDCCCVAAILRLSDELAEGPQRTSLFLQKHFPVLPASEVYHDYANVTSVCVDRPGGRIVLTFDIEISPPEWKQPFDQARLERLLKFCDSRAIKLDLERKYNVHYCSLLRPFKKTEVSFHFHFKGQDLRLGLPKIVLDDLVLPTPTADMSLAKRDKSFDIPSLIPKLREAAGVAETEAQPAA